MNNLARKEPLSLPVVFDDYLAGQISNGTRKVYERDILEIFGGKPSLDLLQSLDPARLVVWRNQAWDNGNGLAATTINRKLTALKSFLDHLVARGMLQVNPASPKLVRRIKEKRRAGARLGILKEELSVLLSACDIGPDPKANARDRALISLLYTCLLRRSEAEGIQWKHFEREGGRSLLRLPMTKGGANDFVPVETRVIQQLDVYFQVMGGAATWVAYFGRPILDCPVFLALDNGHRGERLSDHGINEIVKKRAKIAGIQDISAHILRHSGITHLLMDGYSLADVQAMARHSDPKQTMEYALLIRRLMNSPGRSLAANLGGTVV